MDWPLHELDVLVVDCQASGATPAHGDLLELAWAVCGAEGLLGGVHSHAIVPRTERRISAAVREVTGWSEARLAHSVPEALALRAMLDDVERLARAAPNVATVIHVARFERPFLSDLALRHTGAEMPLDITCVHAVAQRLFPDLPRRNIRALAGYLGHSLGLVRSAAEHVQATAFIWRALVPQLGEQGVHTWPELQRWLEQPAPRVPRGRRTFPLPPERRRALPDRPGVYRFVRKNGDVLYVGKATSLKKRMAGHFRSTGPHTERALELLSQVSDIVVSETPSTLEAALLECDEIKALDPPYNVQLRGHERRAWFAARTLTDVSPVPDSVHGTGPLPSPGAVLALRALEALACGAEATPRLCAMALAVKSAFLPPPALFAEGHREFAGELARLCPRPERRVQRAALALWLLRRGAEPDESSEDLPEGGWDLARVRRRLERNLMQAGLLVRRARWLCLLADADVAFRESGMRSARLLVLSACEIAERRDLSNAAELARLPTRPVRPLQARKAAFDAARYDRLRVLATELQRVASEGGDVLVRVGTRTLAGERLVRITRTI